MLSTNNSYENTSYHEKSTVISRTCPHAQMVWSSYIFRSTRYWCFLILKPCKCSRIVFNLCLREIVWFMGGVNDTLILTKPKRETYDKISHSDFPLNFIILISWAYSLGLNLLFQPRNYCRDFYPHAMYISLLLTFSTCLWGFGRHTPKTISLLCSRTIYLWLVSNHNLIDRNPVTF